MLELCGLTSHESDLVPEFLEQNDTEYGVTRKNPANTNIPGNHFQCMEEAILTHLLTLFAAANEVCLFSQCKRCSMASHQNISYFLYHVTSNDNNTFSYHSNNFKCSIQDVPGEKVNTLGGHSICHSEKKVYST
jgi:hypothetical protein